MRRGEKEQEEFIRIHRILQTDPKGAPNSIETWSLRYGTGINNNLGKQWYLWGISKIYKTSCDSGLSMMRPDHQSSAVSAGTGFEDFKTSVIKVLPCPPRGASFKAPVCSASTAQPSCSGYARTRTHEGTRTSERTYTNAPACNTLQHVRDVIRIRSNFAGHRIVLAIK